MERILSHSGDPKRLRPLDFLVHWQGLDNRENLWIPWKELRNNPILHKYLRDNNLKAFISLMNNMSNKVSNMKTWSVKLII